MKRTGGKNKATCGLSDKISHRWVWAGDITNHFPNFISTTDNLGSKKKKKMKALAIGEHKSKCIRRGVLLLLMTRNWTRPSSGIATQVPGCFSEWGAGGEMVSYRASGFEKGLG